MAAVPTKKTLLELLVVSHLEAIQKQEQTLKTLPRSEKYSEEAECLRSEIAAFQERAERLNRMIDPMRTVGAAPRHDGMAA